MSFIFVVWFSELSFVSNVTTDVTPHILILKHGIYRLIKQVSLKVKACKNFSNKLLYDYALECQLWKNWLFFCLSDGEQLTGSLVSTLRVLGGGMRYGSKMFQEENNKPEKLGTTEGVGNELFRPNQNLLLLIPKFFFMSSWGSS